MDREARVGVTHRGGDDQLGKYEGREAKDYPAKALGIARACPPALDKCTARHHSDERNQDEQRLGKRAVNDPALRVIQDDSEYADDALKDHRADRTVSEYLQPP